MRRPRVTFITHEATRTGAPRVLLTLMRWLKANSNIEMSTLAVRPGSLLPDFAALGPLVNLDGDWRHFVFVQRALRLAGHLTSGADRNSTDGLVNRASGTALWFANIRALDTLGDCDLVYANSVQSGWGVRAIRSHAPLLSHLHELGDCLLDPYEKSNVDMMCGGAKQIIVPAVAVRDLLINALGIPGSDVSVHYPFIDVRSHEHGGAARLSTRARLGIPEDAVVVGMSGMFIMRKGPDCFVRIAAKVLAESTTRPVYFVWIGGGQNTEYGRYVTADITLLGLQERIRLVPEQVDPLPYFDALDIFLLTSRSDPFPLVCLEAAVQAEVPIVCFANAGGMPELVGTECGVVVPYMDVDAAADALVNLVEDQSRRRQLGKNASEAVRTRHDVSRVAPHIAEVMREVAGTGGRRSTGRSSVPAPQPSPNGTLDASHESAPSHRATALVDAKH